LFALRCCINSPSVLNVITDNRALAIVSTSSASL